MLMALSKDRTPETAAPDASTFVKSLATAWRTAKYGRRIARKRNRANMAERGLILCRSLASVAWMAGRKT